MNPTIFPFVLGLPVAGTILCAIFRRRRILELATVATSGLTFLAALLVIAMVLDGKTLTSDQGWWFADGLSAYVAVIVSGSAFVVALYSTGYLRRQIILGKVDNRHLWLYYLLLNAFLFTMMLVLFSNNLGILWIGTEATTLATAFLVAFYERESSIEAAWKYVIICSVGIALALFGIILTYFSGLHVVPQSGNALNWSSLLQVAKELDPGVLKLAFVFILVGFGTKAGLAPMHSWKPDAYGESPAPISALMAAGLVNVALYAIMRFYILLNASRAGNFGSVLFITFGLLSMAVAVPFILVQRDFKRLLAYSSVEHVGIILFALGLATPLAYFGAMLHLLNNAIAKTLLFLTASNLRTAYRSRLMRKISGAFKVVPVSATILILGVFAITGWPPFGVFVSEFTIVSEGFRSGNMLPATMFIVFLAAIFAGFVYYTAKMVFGEPPSTVTGGEVGAPSLVLLGVLLLALFILGVYLPPQLQQSIRSAVSVLAGS